jgi:hypothetical protein
VGTCLLPHFPLAGSRCPWGVCVKTRTRRRFIVAGSLNFRCGRTIPYKTGPGTARPYSERGRWPFFGGAKWLLDIWSLELGFERDTLDYRIRFESHAPSTAPQKFYPATQATHHPLGDRGIAAWARCASCTLDSQEPRRLARLARWTAGLQRTWKNRVGEVPCGVRRTTRTSSWTPLVGEETGGRDSTVSYILWAIP